MKKVIEVMRKIDDSWVGDLLGCIFGAASAYGLSMMLYALGGK
jgi:hypothetical protein